MKARPRHSGLFFALFSIWLPLVAAIASESIKRSEVAKTDVIRDSSPRSDYVLQPLDILKVQVFQEEDINKQGEVRITERYEITLPLIGTVNLKGKNVRQAEDLVRRLYDKDYLVNPQVNIQVLKYAERFVNVTGAVNKADRVPFPQERGLTLYAAITGAGGPSRIADLKKVRLTRKGPDGEPVMREINVDEIIKGKADDVALENDDTIHVPERIL